MHFGSSLYRFAAVFGRRYLLFAHVGTLAYLGINGLFTALEHTAVSDGHIEYLLERFVAAATDCFRGRNVVFAHVNVGAAVCEDSRACAGLAVCKLRLGLKNKRDRDRS